MKRILLTGGAGFIGGALAKRLLERHEVVVFDNHYRNARYEAETATNLTHITGDVLDSEAMKGAMAGCDAVVHMASIAGVDTVRRMPVQTMRVALQGTFNALDSAVAVGGVKRFIDFSTSEVFGSMAWRVGERDATTLGAVGEARWTYAVSKLATEHLAHSFRSQFDLPTLSVRPFNIYGPGQIGEGAIHRFVTRALRGDDIEIHNDGGQIRAWCYIDDIVEAVLMCLENDNAVGEVFNIGNARSAMSIHELARLIVRISGSSSKIRFVDWPNADVELRVPDTNKAERILGFRAKVDIDEGLERTIAWYRDKGQA